MKIDLEGRVALVTGGAVGLGAAIALALARAGADVGFTYFSHDAHLTELSLSETGRQFRSWRLDATDAASVSRVMQELIARFGKLDIVVNNAGGMIRRATLAEMDNDYWHAVVDLNLSSAFYCARAALPHLSDAGRMIFMSSLAAQNGGSIGQVGYATAKAGLLGMTRALAKELAPRGKQSTRSRPV